MKNITSFELNRVNSWNAQNCDNNIVYINRISYQSSLGKNGTGYMSKHLINEVLKIKQIFDTRSGRARKHIHKLYFYQNITMSIYCKFQFALCSPQFSVSQRIEFNFASLFILKPNRLYSGANFIYVFMKLIHHNSSFERSLLSL